MPAKVTKAREAAAWRVAGNWRIQKRLPRLTALAKQLGFTHGTLSHDSRPKAAAEDKDCLWVMTYVYTDSKGLVSAEVHGIYTNYLEAANIRQGMENPFKYFIRKARKP